jgi:chitin disaccharide deacetylase
LKSRKRLIVNADDFGFTPDVNEGIVEAHLHGILTATTLMATGEAFDHAARLAERHPTLDVGCHLVLVGGRSELTGRPLPLSVSELLLEIGRRRIRIYDELEAQVRKIQAAGIRPTHLDTHKHTHLAPPVLLAVARIADTFGIRWVRRPFDFPMTTAAPFLKRATSRALGLVRNRFHRTLEQHRCRTTDTFAGFQITGRFRTRELVHLIHQLPDGLTELMCHPGLCGEALRQARTRLKESREDELRALIAPETRRALDECGVELLDYRRVGR